MKRLSTRTLILWGLAVSLVLAGVASYYASSRPDGLEYVAEQNGIAGQAQQHGSTGSPLAEYGVSGVHNARLSGGLAGVIGVLLVAALAFGLMAALRRHGRASTPDPGA
ncbi:MAG TPA: PDGLE domain-containing protein [Tetrasphaera sp.]|uniref:PDGLE domain-containing protein n=1 Tax=Nostocoides sp. TaxID=1917966 RepID=UPI002CB465D1|nr:PDGLE domain-containing protein [Tetrasphaera sp.]HNQ08128.1 PDGLE domain-containing protein [Tetrasphaera sp.]